MKRHYEQPKKMIVFDMDNTLLQDRFIDSCAERFNFVQALSLIRQIDKDPVSLTKRIASFLRGRQKTELLNIGDAIPIVEDVYEVIMELKKRSYVIGIISDCYQVITQLVAKKINADFELANELQFISGIATGEVLIPSYFHYSGESQCKHQVCKSNALRYIAKIYRIELQNCLAVGDSENDVCMLKHAGTGVSFCTKSELLRNVAGKNIEHKSFHELLNLAP